MSSNDETYFKILFYVLILYQLVFFPWHLQFALDNSRQMGGVKRLDWKLDTFFLNAIF